MLGSVAVQATLMHHRSNTGKSNAMPGMWEHVCAGIKVYLFVAKDCALNAEGYSAPRGGKVVRRTSAVCVPMQDERIISATPEQFATIPPCCDRLEGWKLGLPHTGQKETCTGHPSRRPEGARL